MFKYQTLDKLKEMVYEVRDTDTEDNISFVLSSFMNELMERRKYDRLEGGMQASGVILPNNAGFKINEGDGKATHAHTLETLSQYLNGETMFSGENTVNQFGLRRNDPNGFLNIPKNGIKVRIIASEDRLIFIFETYLSNLTPFQLDVVERIVNNIEKEYQSGIIKKPFINYITGKDRFIFDEDKNYYEELNRLKEIISERKEELKSKAI